MFGDIGHGLGLLIVGCAMIFYQDVLKHHPYGKMFYPVRYLITMMGFFATF